LQARATASVSSYSAVSGPQPPLPLEVLVLVVPLVVLLVVPEVVLVVPEEVLVVVGVVPPLPPPPSSTTASPLQATTIPSAGSQPRRSHFTKERVMSSLVHQASAAGACAASASGGLGGLDGDRRRESPRARGVKQTRW
jgi:hypothetical protein